MSLNGTIWCSKLINGHCKIVNKSQVVTKFNVTKSRLHCSWFEHALLRIWVNFMPSFLLAFWHHLRFDFVAESIFGHYDRGMHKNLTNFFIQFKHKLCQFPYQLLMWQSQSNLRQIVGLIWTRSSLLQVRFCLGAATNN